MSFSTLSIGASALTAAQRGVENAAHNIANSTVEGYTRQRLDLVTAAPTPGTAGMRGSGMRGNGVLVASVDRLRSSVNDLAVRGEAATAGSAGARAQVLDRAQAVLGPYGSGVPDSLTKLWTAFTALSNAPGGSAARTLTLDAAHQVAGGLNDAAHEVAQVRSDTVAQVGNQVDEVNTLTTSVADLNKHITAALAAGEAPNDLLDSRDVALDRLAELVGATVTPRDNGSVDVAVGAAVLVQGETANAMTTVAVPAPGGSTGNDVALQVGGQPVTAGGAVGGGVSVLATDLRDVEHRLDDLAKNIADTVNAQHAQGFDANGAPGGAFFSGSTAATFSVDPALTPDRIAASGTQVAGGSPYDGTAATRLAALRQAGPGGQSLDDRAVGLATLLGSRASGAARTADAADSSLDGLRQQRDAANGVSVDEEMVDLVKFQHSYDAASRVISIADGMLDTIINRMGAGR